MASQRRLIFHTAAWLFLISTSNPPIMNNGILQLKPLFFLCNPFQKRTVLGKFSLLYISVTFSSQKLRLEKEVSFAVVMSNATTMGSHTVCLTPVGSPHGRGMRCKVCGVHLTVAKVQKSC